MSPSPQPSELLTASEVFRRDAPYYLSIGVPYDLYWNSNDPEILREYIEADKIHQQRMNEEAWLHGAYIARAIMATIGNAFLAKGAKPTEYPQQPIELIKHEKTEAEQEQEAENERLRLVALLDRVRESRQGQ